MPTKEVKSQDGGNGFPASGYHQPKNICIDAILFFFFNLSSSGLELPIKLHPSGKPLGWDFAGR